MKVIAFVIKVEYPFFLLSEKPLDVYQLKEKSPIFEI